MEAVERISKELNTGLTREALVAVVDLLDAGVSSDAIVAIIHECYNRK